MMSRVLFMAVVGLWLDGRNIAAGVRRRRKPLLILLAEVGRLASCSSRWRRSCRRRRCGRRWLVGIYHGHLH